MMSGTFTVIWIISVTVNTQENANCRCLYFQLINLLQKNLLPKTNANTGNAVFGRVVLFQEQCGCDDSS